MQDDGDEKQDEETGEWITYFTAIPCVQLIKDYFAGAIAIDVHNHFRQGSIGLEHVWKTTKWYHRLFSTLFTTCVVDAFKGYNLEKNQNPLSLRDFITQLSLELILSGENKEEAKVEQEEETFDEKPSMGSYHNPRKRARNSKRKQVRQRRCMCSDLSSTFCNRCGKPLHAPINRMGTKRSCYNKHQRSEHS